MPRSPSFRISNLQPGPLVKIERQRTDSRVLVAESEAGFALVRCDQIEILELEDVAPAVGDLAVGHAHRARRDGLGELRDCDLVEDAVAEIAEDNDIHLMLGQLVALARSTSCSEMGRLSSLSTLSIR